MDGRLTKLPGSSLRMVPQQDRGGNVASAGRGRKQFKPNVNVAANDEKIASEQSLSNTSALAEPKQEPNVEASAEKKRINRPPRGFDRVSSIFEQGVGQNALSARSAPSVPRISAEGSHSSVRARGAGAQENFIETLTDQTGYEANNMQVTAVSEARGGLDPITPFQDGKLASAEDTNKCASFVFENGGQSPLLFQIPFGSVFDATSAASGPIKLGRIQKLKSGKMRLIIPVNGSNEQLVPNAAETPTTPTNSLNASRLIQSVTLNFSSASQPSSPLNQIICVHAQQPTGIKSDPASAVTLPKTANRPNTLPSISSKLFVLGRVAARVSSSVNL